MRKSIKEASTRKAIDEALRSPVGERGHRGLRELVVEAGMQAVARMLEEERTAMCGPRYVHDGWRTHVRGGYARGEVVFGGRRVQVERPRVFTKGRKEERNLSSWQAFANTDPLGERAVEQVLVGVSTRKYKRSLESLPSSVRERGMSKSAVSRRFVALTQGSMEKMLRVDLRPLSLLVVMLDALEIAGHAVVVALGIDDAGTKHILGLAEGSTENGAVCNAFVSSLAARGVHGPLLVVIDGGKALAKAVRDVWGDMAVVQRCQVHKMRNVKEHLPESMHVSAMATMKSAYDEREPKHAERTLRAFAERIEEKHPGAAASLREGLVETLTVSRLGLTGSLFLTLRSTNPIENINSLIRTRLRNVKKWKGGKMILRWVATALIDAKKSMRKIRGVKALPKLRAALHPHHIEDDKLRAA